MTSIRHFINAAALALPAVALTTPAFAEDLQFELINNSAYTVVQFYTSPTNMGDWREDILGAEVLPSGESGTVTVTDGSDQCIYDIRVVLDDSSELTDTVDMCEMGSYTLN